MPEVWFGAMPFGTQVGEGAAQAMVRRCLEAGITLFDTADVYGAGRSEEILGRALKGVRGVAVATKVGTRFDGNEMYRARYWHRPMFGAVARLGEIARQAGKTLVGSSIQRVARRVEGIILGGTSVARLEENLSALEGFLDEAALRACDEVWEGLRGSIPRYNR